MVPVRRGGAESVVNLLEAVERDRKLMLTAVTEAKARGVALAKAESEYQVAKHRKVLQLKAEGVPSTLIQLLVKGDEDVSLKLFERDCAQVEYDSAREAINAYKLSARLVEAQIQREWNMAGGNI